MSPIAQVLLAGFAIPALGLGYVGLTAMPTYIPDRAMDAAARTADTPHIARDRILGLLEACAPRSDVTPMDFATRLSTIRSFENDAGVLATTHVACDGTRCTISASALIPHAARPDVCGGHSPGRSGYHGRRNGWGDWFPN